VREAAVIILSHSDVEPREVVPALTACLSDTNVVIRRAAAEGLGRFGTNALWAVPVLVPLLREPDRNVRRAARNAFKVIDPEAAAKAGVK
jgi:HEAT repeat protein